MGQSCVPQQCEQVTAPCSDLAAPNGLGLGASARLNPARSANIQHLTAEEAIRKIEALALELRMLKDDNYRIREEQLELERGLAELGMTSPSSTTALSGSGPGRPLSAGGSDKTFVGGSLGSDRGGYSLNMSLKGGVFSSSGDVRNLAADQRGPEFAAQQRQLAQLYDAVRNLEEENRRLRETRNRDGPASDASTDAGGDDVSEEEYRGLQERLARLQQSHLRQLQEARQLKARSSLSSAATSGVSTPISSGFAAGMAPGDAHGGGLQAQYQALLQEQEVLRSKVRKLAHTTA